ncbi:MAG: hypothetical protein SGI77_23600 [Pirellulaceae bacterium]|nr:hypothetical protein [Pirellulaceae bacterium]
MLDDARKDIANEPPAIDSLTELGGRWYFDPRGGDKKPPSQFDYTNVDQLFYLGGRLSAPFSNNASAWLCQGWLDLNGNMVEKDRLIRDHVVIIFTNE